MGHYWRDMCPEQAAEHDRQHTINREIRDLQAKLRTQAASLFTVEEVLAIGVDMTDRKNYDRDNTELLHRLRRAVAGVKHRSRPTLAIIDHDCFSRRPSDSYA